MEFSLFPLISVLESDYRVCEERTAAQIVLGIFQASRFSSHGCLDLKTNIALQVGRAVAACKRADM